MLSFNYQTTKNITACVEFQKRPLKTTQYRTALFLTFLLCSLYQIEAQLAEYHKLARKLKLIPKGAENSKGHDFEIKFNPEAGAKCLVKYKAQVYVSLCLKFILSMTRLRSKALSPSLFFSSE